MELKRRLDSIARRPRFRQDLELWAQTDRAAGSAPRNIAEGFGRFQHKEFAQFLKIARSSLLETQSNLLEARDKGYLTDDEFQELWTLSEQAIAATARLWRYLAGK